MNSLLLTFTVAVDCPKLETASIIAGATAGSVTGILVLIILVTLAVFLLGRLCITRVSCYHNYNNIYC